MPPLPTPPPPEAVFRAGRQLVKARLLWAFLTGVGAVGVWAGVHIALTYGLSPADGGALRPPAQRIALGGAVVLLSLAAMVGMWIYARCYVASMALDRDGRHVRIRTLTPVGTSEHVVALGDIENVTYRDGEMQARITVNAPWLSLRVRGRRLPFIVDLQGEIPGKRLTVRGR